MILRQMSVLTKLRNKISARMKIEIIKISKNFAKTKIFDFLP